MRFKHLTVADGLIQSNVNAIARDQSGFMWFGTNDGVSRFNGYSFSNYKAIPDNYKTLRRPLVMGILADSSGNVWIGAGGINKYTPVNDSFLYFKNHIYKSKIEYVGNVQDMVMDKKGLLWFRAHQDVMVCFNTLTGISKNYSLSHSLNKEEASMTLKSFCLDKNNQLWIILNNTIYQTLADTLIHRGDKMNLKVVLTSPNAISHFNTIYCDNHNSIYVSSLQGLLIFDTLSHEFKKYTPDNHFNRVFGNKNIKACYVDHLLNMWINTSDGVYCYTAHEKSIIPFLHNENDENSISSNLIYTIYSTPDDIIWFGTDNGVEMLDLRQKSFLHLFKNPKDKNSIVGNNISSIYEDQEQRLWLGSKNGLTCYHPKENMYYRFMQDDKIPHILGSNYIFCINEYENDLLIGGVGLQRINYTKGSFGYAYPIKNDTNSLTEFIVWGIHKGKKSGDYWLATHKGVNRVLSLPSTPGNGQVYPLNLKVQRLLSDNNKGLIEGICFDVYEDSKGKIWVSQGNGLSTYDPSKNKYKRYWNASTGSKLPQGAVRCVTEDQNGVIWVGVEGGGLCRYDEQSDSFISYSMNDGLPSNIIWGILIDNSGNLWMSTTAGLSRFNPETKIFKNYKQSDGLQSNEFNPGAYCKLNDGRLAFGGINGITIFDPEAIDDNPHPPLVAITSLSLFNKTITTGQKINGDIILTNPLKQTKEITLNHRNNVLSVEFTALHYANPQEIVYEYLMEGFDKDWIKTGYQRRLAHYTNLKPGTYILKIRAYNSDGIVSNENTSLTIHVLPPFWKTWWFRLLMLLLIIFGMISYVRYRMFAIQQKNIELEKQVKERTRKIEEQNTEITIQAESLKKVNHSLIEHQKEIESASAEIKAQADELNYANQELMKLNATKDKFFSIIAHDLKNPFQGIMGSSELLYNLYEQYNDSERKEFIKNISDSSKGAYTLLENLLVWSRSQTNRIQFDPKHFLFHEIINSTFQVLKLNADQKNILLKSSVSADISVYADMNMLTTVIRNLINNAIKFTPEKGSISVDAERKDETVLITISDSGVGMSNEQMAKLFKIDSQHTTHGTSGETGTGLGLIICKEFIDKNNGQIYVKSKAGEGTQFFIELPCDSSVIIDAPNSIPTVENSTDSKIITDPYTYEPIRDDDLDYQSTIADSSNEKYSVLIVEDNVNIRSNIRQTLQNFYLIEEAENGISGLEKAMASIPDIIISDVMMPEMDGFELCAKLKIDQQTSHIPIILLTAKSSDNSKMKGLDIGADDYITKPFNAQLLLTRIRSLIRSREKLREIFSRELVIKPSDITVNSIDEDFIRKAIQLVEVNISDSEFGVDNFVEQMGMGRTQLYKKVKSLTNQGVNDFIQSIRLKRAAQLLSQSPMNISEVAYEVGFNYPEYFSKCFKKQFGVLPTEYGTNKT